MQTDVVLAQVRVMSFFFLTPSTSFVQDVLFAQQILSPTSWKPGLDSVERKCLRNAAYVT